jgi:hypothetical protein
MSCAHSFGEWCSECIDGLVRDYNAARQRLKELAAVQIRCERVADGLATALTFPSRLLLDTAVRESIKELRALPPAPEVKEVPVKCGSWSRAHATPAAEYLEALTPSADPISAAVDAQLAEVGDQVKAFGHTLAKGLSE